MASQKWYKLKREQYKHVLKGLMDEKTKFNICFDLEQKGTVNSFETIFFP